MGLIQDTKKVRTAIVGCGSISDIYFQNMIQRFQILDVVKCCSKGGNSAVKKAEQYGVEKSTLDELLSDPSIELIVNLTPAPQHYDIIKAALEAGKHVYTEKVLTPDLDSAKALMALAKEKGLYLCVAPDLFLGSAWQCARELIDRGMIGEVTSVLASINQNVGDICEMLGFVNEPGGGIAYDFGIYLISAMVHLLGPVESVCGIMQNRFPDRIYRSAANPCFGEPYTFINDSMLSGTLAFKSGAVGSIHMNGTSVSTPLPMFMVYGTEGILSLPNPGLFSGEVKLYRAGSLEPSIQVPAHGLNENSRSAGVAEMAWAIRQKRPARASAEFGVHCLEAIWGLEQSSRSKSFYTMTTSCERPKALPRGFLGKSFFSVDEEGALVL